MENNEWNYGLTKRPPPNQQSIKEYGKEKSEYFGLSVDCIVELSNGNQWTAFFDYQHNEFLDSESMGGYNVPVVRWKIK
jgi:hypothetical protein